MTGSRPPESVDDDGGEKSERIKTPALVGPSEVPRIGVDLAGLCRTSSTVDAPFLAEGRAAWALGRESGSGMRVGIGFDTRAVIEPRGLGTAAATLHFPGVVRRHFVGQRGTCTETLVVGRTLPFVVCQWSSPSGSLPEAIAVRIRAPGEADDGTPGDDSSDPPDPKRDGSTVWLESSGGATAVTTVPPTRALQLQSGARILVHPAEGEHASLVVASGPTETVRSALAASRHLEGHAVRSACGPVDGLVPHTGVLEIDDGIEWLQARLDAQLHRWISARGSRVLSPTSQGPRASAPERDLTVLGIGLAAVATGLRDGVERLLSIADEASSSYGLVAARFASVFGDTRFAARAAEAWTAGPPPGQDPLGRLAARLLVNALDHSWHPNEMAGLRAMGLASASRDAGPDRAPLVYGGAPSDTDDPTPQPSPGERRLPTLRAGRRRLQEHVDAGDRAHEAAWWTGLLTSAPLPPLPHGDRSDVQRAREACARFSSDPDGAWVRWRTLLSAPPQHGATLWDVPPPEEARARPGGSLSAELLLAFSHGLLGVDADAPAGRIRIAPRLPSHVTDFSLGGVRVGRASLRLHYRRDGRRHVFELVPEEASVPPLVLLEPRVDGRIRELRIDGDPADLDLREEGSGTSVPVQLPLDGPRTLEIETEP
ncbi:MAG: hypothetical protein R3304_00655 [Longimicrobiales bacterium]|nr:hypothetical protein [Longimicrobiales bacterium]